MAFAHTNKKGQTYFLHQKRVTLRGNNQLQTIYFFSREEKEGAMDELPEGYFVKEVEGSGLPVLKKVAR